jgi:hypothetical protein
VSRSFFHSRDLLRLRGHYGGSRLSTGPDTCFVNIVGPYRTPWFISGWQMEPSPHRGGPQGNPHGQQSPGWVRYRNPRGRESSELVLGFRARLNQL